MKDSEAGLRRVKKGSDYAFCTFCAKDIKISGGGANDLSRHSETALNLRSTKGCDYYTKYCSVHGFFYHASYKGHQV